VECTSEFSKGINAQKHCKSAGGHKINEERAQVPFNFLLPKLTISIFMSMNETHSALMLTKQLALLRPSLTSRNSDHCKVILLRKLYVEFLQMK